MASKQWQCTLGLVQENAGAAGRGGKARKKAKAEGAAQPRGVSLPFRANKHVTGALASLLLASCLLWEALKPRRRLLAWVLSRGNEATETDPFPASYYAALAHFSAPCCAPAHCPCAVLALGRIEWIHPGFHDEKYLWPVGYKAERLAATPASQVGLVAG